MTVRAVALMAFSATLFAFMNFFARLATATGSWATVGAVRALVGALVAYGVARMRGRSLATQHPGAIFWRSMLGTISMFATFYALSSRTVSLGSTVTLVNLAPVFLALLAPLILRERTSARVAFAIALSLGGVVLVVKPSFLFHARGATLAGVHVGPSETVTIAVALVAALSTSAALMALRHAGQLESPEAIAFHFSIFAAVSFTLIAAFDFRIPASRDVVFMIGAGLCAGVAQLAMTRAYALESAARVGGVSYLAVVVSALLGALTGELPDVTAMLGMALVILGGVLSLGRRPRVETPRAAGI